MLCFASPCFVLSVAPGRQIRNMSESPFRVLIACLFTPVLSWPDLILHSSRTSLGVDQVLMTLTMMS